MSKAHHDSTYYQWLLEHQPTCLFCGSGQAVQLHHAQLVGASRYAGLLPRRHSSYNVVPACDACHRELHAQGEARFIREKLGGERVLYRTVLGWLHLYLTWLMEERG